MNDSLGSEIRSNVDEIEHRSAKLSDARNRLLRESRDIATDCVKMNRANYGRMVKLGEKCVAFNRHAEALGLSRQEARDLLRKQLIESTGQDFSQDISRCVKVFHAYQCFGQDFLNLPQGTQRKLSAYVVEDPKTGEWGIEGQYESQIRSLYTRLLTTGKEALTCKEINEAFSNIRAPGTALGRKRADNSSPPVIRLQEQPTQRTPADCAVFVQKAVSNCQAPADALHLLGQRLDSNAIIALMGGWLKNIVSDDDREHARQQWSKAWSTIREKADSVEELLGNPQVSRRAA